MNYGSVIIVGTLICLGACFFWVLRCLGFVLRGFLKYPLRLEAVMLMGDYLWRGIMGLIYLSPGWTTCFYFSLKIKNSN